MPASLKAVSLPRSQHVSVVCTAPHSAVSSHYVLASFWHGVMALHGHAITAMHWTAGRWEARVGVPGSRHVYLGLYNHQEEAARAYDSALVRLKGAAAATNFPLAAYDSDLAAHHRLQQASWNLVCK